MLGGQKIHQRHRLSADKSLVFVAVFVAVAIFIVVVIRMAVPPIPVFFLLIGAALAKFAMIFMIFRFPLLVINDLAVIPAVIITVVWVINPVVMMLRTAEIR